jgi:hypothetical protein
VSSRSLPHRLPRIGRTRLPSPEGSSDGRRPLRYRTIDDAAQKSANATVAARKGKKAMTAQQLAALAVQNHVDAIADSLQHHAGGLLPPQTALQLAYNMYVADETTPNPEYLALNERREHLLVRFVLFPLAHTQLRGDGAAHQPRGVHAPLPAPLSPPVSLSLTRTPLERRRN